MTCAIALHGGPNLTLCLCVCEIRKSYYYIWNILLLIIELIIITTTHIVYSSSWSLNPNTNNQIVVASFINRIICPHRGGFSFSRIISSMELDSTIFIFNYQEMKYNAPCLQFTLNLIWEWVLIIFTLQRKRHHSL